VFSVDALVHFVSETNFLGISNFDYKEEKKTIPDQYMSETVRVDAGLYFLAGRGVL
jgi:hypothetical protein